MVLQGKTLINKMYLGDYENRNLSIRGSNNTLTANHIYCVGRNYSSHAREMGADERKPPFFFSKPDWAITTSDVKYPENTDNLQHEVELVIVIGKNMSIFGYAVGVDLTQRDIQADAKKQGKPWFRSKCFLGSAPISEVIMADKNFNHSDIDLLLSVNGKIKQSGSCNDMIWSPVQIISKLATEIPLYPGDLIFTGTPEGVGKVEEGDVLNGFIEQKEVLKVFIK